MTNNDNKNRKTNIGKLLSILWTQHEDASKNGYLVVNGAFIPSPDDNTYREVNKKLLKDYSLSIFDEPLVKNYMNNSINRLYKNIFSLDIIPEDDSIRGTILFFLARRIKSLPYYQATLKIELSDDDIDTFINNYICSFL